jgi:hypothetical protein
LSGDNTTFDVQNYMNDGKQTQRFTSRVVRKLVGLTGQQCCAVLVLGSEADMLKCCSKVLLVDRSCCTPMPTAAFNVFLAGEISMKKYVLIVVVFIALAVGLGPASIAEEASEFIKDAVTQTRVLCWAVAVTRLSPRATARLTLGIS